MDLQALQAVVPELAEKLAGARIAKIHQPAAQLIILRLWNGSENLKLLIFAAAEDCRLALSDETFANPFTPPRFCQLLRARLSRIRGVEQVDNDRVVKIDCVGPKGDCSLYVELFGRHSNLILVASDGKIIDALKRSRAGQGRCIRAGERYRLPERKETPVKEGREVFDEQVEAGPQVAGLLSRLQGVLRKAKKKLTRRLKNISEEQKEQAEFDRYRQWGDLILSNLQHIEKGQARVELTNYYLTPVETEILSLDPMITPQENAERYFHKYKKLRRGLEHSARRLAETEAELEWIQQLEYMLDGAGPEEVADTAAELKAAGLLREVENRLPKATRGAARTPYHETASPGGFRVLWGSSSRQNDLLSTKVLKKGDLWLHVLDYPGAHVVLKASPERGGFAEEDRRFAASLAAAHSKAKTSAKVEVMIADARDVRKPSGAKPGMVTVKKYSTLVVRPLTSP